VLILADEPILKRPFSVALVEYALPQACMVDKPLCAKVKRYLQRYSRDYAVTHASATGAVTLTPMAARCRMHTGCRSTADGNCRRRAMCSRTTTSSFSGGAIAHEGRTVADRFDAESRFNWAQLDIGYRDHWLSPATDSSMLLSTEAPTMPSVTLSN